MPTLRERILLKSDNKTAVVFVPEWDEQVKVRNLTAHEIERWYDILSDHTEKGVDVAGGRKASLVFMGSINDDGTSLFQAEDIKLLGEKHPTAIHRIFEAIRRVSGLTEEVQAEAEKKPDDQTNSSSTGSLTDLV
jgi:hypothetical protein